MLSAKLKEAAGNSADATLYVDDVFSTWLYTGNGSTQTITNGIDLAGKGGLVWVKSRSAATNNFLFDTTRGVNVEINSNTTDANATLANSVTAFNSSGFALGSAAGINVSAATYASWTFREAPKFFDVVTYTGNEVNGRVIPHNLGIAPGMIFVKSTTYPLGWPVYHRSNPATSELYLNATDALSYGGKFPTIPTSSEFYISSNDYVNKLGETYVAYLFAHDTSSTGIIQCGSFTTDGSGNFTPVNLGWETQYILYKKTNAVGNWNVGDVMRGMAVTNDPASPPPSGSSQVLYPNTNGPEANGIYISPTATGFSSSYSGAFSASSTYIYMAIRRPNKPPTTGTQVFASIARNGANFVATSITSVGFPTDLSIVKNRDIGGVNFEWDWQDRLRALPYWLNSSATDAETYAAQNIKTYNMTGVTFGTSSLVNGNSAQTYINYFLKRAPGFFDEVCYTGTGVATTQAHNLTVAPELMIVKERSAVNNWWVYVSSVGNTKYSVLNSTATPTTSSTAWNNTTPTASIFSIGTGSNVNASAQTFVAYLFATLAGISKVGSYTGNGTGQAIACGFGSAGARFVLIKRTDSTGDWYTFDSARGLTSGSSPYLRLNSTAAEVTGNNGVYASSGGFTLDATAITTTNIATATYIFLAVA